MRRSGDGASPALKEMVDLLLRLCMVIAGIWGGILVDLPRPSCKRRQFCDHGIPFRFRKSHRIVPAVLNKLTLRQDNGKDCPKMKGGSCKCKAPAALCYQPLAIGGIRTLLAGLPVKGNVVDDLQIAKSFVEEYLYNVDNVTAESFINHELRLGGIEHLL